MRTTQIKYNLLGNYGGFHIRGSQNRYNTMTKKQGGQEITLPRLNFLEKPLEEEDNVVTLPPFLSKKT